MSKQEDQILDLSPRTGVKRWTTREGWAGMIAAAPRAELEQAGLRLGIGSLVLVVLMCLALRQDTSGSELQMIWVLAGFVTFAAAITSWVLLVPRRSPTRLVLGIVADNAATTYFMLQMGEYGVIVFGIYLFVAFGNAFRFGQNYLRISHGVALIGFTLILWVSDFWSQHIPIGMGLYLTLLVVPIYVGLLFERLKNERLRAEQALEQCIEAGQRGS